jgi:Tfp pilus assembly protein PilX
MSASTVATKIRRMIMHTRGKRGSALVLVLIASVFLIVLTSGAYQYFKMNARTQTWARDRIQAKLTAEAGINLATHKLVAGASLPSGNLPQDILGGENSFFDLPGDMGSVYATVDPSDINSEVTSANAYRIRCIAAVPGTTIETYGMESIVMPENLARFSVFMDDPSTNGYYADGYRFDGPFYANGPVRVISYSTSSDNDPFFYTFRLTSDYYLSIGSTHRTTPAVGNLQMRPYNRLSMGAPYFELGVDTIPFGADELNWQGVKNAATADGLLLARDSVPNGARLVLKGDTLFVKKNSTAVLDTFFLGDMDNPVVWIDNDPGDHFYLRGDQTQGLGMALTIGCIGDVYMSGPLEYANKDLEDPDNEILLGVMTVRGDLVIADAPDVLPDPAWLGPMGGECYQIRTDDDFSYYAVIVALEGNLIAEKYNQPPGPKEFRVVGGYMIQEEGYTSTSGAGFNIGVLFDPRLLFMHPPFFPTTANWNTTMWAEHPDFTVQDVSSPSPY